jgi:transposase
LNKVQYWIDTEKIILLIAKLTIYLLQKNMVNLTTVEVDQLRLVQKYSKDTYLVKRAGILLGYHAKVSLDILSLMFNLHERTICNYIDCFLNNGLAVYLKPSEQGGSRSKLSAEQQSELKIAMEAEPPIGTKAVVEIIKKNRGSL